MKSFWYVLGGIIVISIIVWATVSFPKSGNKIAGYSISDPNAPKIELQEKSFDFGKIKLSDIVKHEFKIKNTGKNPLIIKDIMTSCHCTSAILKISGKADSPEFGMHMNSWKGEILSEREAVIQVIYKPADMPVSGRVSRVVTFQTNDPGSKEIQLEIIANVE